MLPQFFVLIADRIKLFHFNHLELALHPAFNGLYGLCNRARLKQVESLRQTGWFAFNDDVFHF